MHSGKTFLAIIPARGGSKRLPRKNILDLAGKPLIAWSIEVGLIDKEIIMERYMSDFHRANAEYHGVFNRLIDDEIKYICKEIKNVQQ